MMVGVITIAFDEVSKAIEEAVEAVDQQEKRSEESISENQLQNK
jgi:hypothetical protein